MWQVLPFESQVVKITGHNLVVKHVTHPQKTLLLSSFLIAEHIYRRFQIFLVVGLQFRVYLVNKDFLLEDG